MNTTVTTIMNHIAKQLGGDGAVVIAKDFLHLASRDAVDQALRRLNLSNDLNRIGRGLYYKPRTNPRLGIAVPPDADLIAQAIGRQTGDRVVPSSAVIANQLGLSTQIPAKLVYITTGRTRSIQVGSRTFYFKRVSAKKLPNIDSPVGRALYAIDAIGPHPDASILHAIGSTLDKAQKQSLMAESRYSVGWVADSARQIATIDDQVSAAANG